MTIHSGTGVILFNWEYFSDSLSTQELTFVLKYLCCANIDIIAVVRQSELKLDAV